jgi:imidazolonepropionase-like amidohydrolase
MLTLMLILSTQAFTQDKPVALRGGKLLTVTHGVIENGVIVMQGGKITAVGVASDVNVPGNAQVIDATGMTIYPGLIDSETHLGLTEISAENMTNDLVELSDEIMPHMHTPPRPSTRSRP